MDTIILDNSQPTNILASKEKRFINFLIDYPISIIFTVLFSTFFLSTLELSGVLSKYAFISSDAFSILGFYFFWPFYYIISEGLFDGTIGKAVTKTKVVDFNGQKPAFWRILIRSYSRFIPYEPMTFISQKRLG
ncbi:MAG: RDD family protein [Bacteroidetes bacterium]|nr:RDD family protein [Bacteroidota bacterium]